MSKLSIIRQTLEQKAVIVRVDEENIPLDLCMCWPHKVDFYIAPKEGIYTAEGLNKFMDSLIPDIKPDYKSYFNLKYKSHFRRTTDVLIAGALCFDEKIGELRTKYERFITITDDDMIKGCEWTKGRFIIDSIGQMDYMRRITVRPYPNEAIAKHILEHHGSIWKIEMELIRKFRMKEASGKNSQYG